MHGPQWEEFYPHRPVDASHPTMWLDLDRCILCKLCVRASHEKDGKDVFAIGGHGIGAHLIVNSPSGRLGDSTLAPDDFAASVCPVGAILPKRRGFAVPIGERRFDRSPVSACQPGISRSRSPPGWNAWSRNWRPPAGGSPAMPGWKRICGRRCRSGRMRRTCP